MSKIVEQFQSSELSRNGKDVFSAAEHSPVLVTRRDGEDLVLMSEREDDARRTLLEFAAQLIAVTTDDRGSLVERMTNMFPWMLALNEKDQATCSDVLIRAARASFATQQPHLAISELNAWRETANAVAAGLPRLPVDWLNDDLLVPNPS